VVTIRSAHDGTTLELFERAGRYFLARVIGPNFQGTAKVYDDSPQHLKRFFSDLAANWKGWKGKKEWQSLESELALCATSDSIGHASLSIELHSGDYPFDWTLLATIELEAGQLERLARSVAAFVGDEDAQRNREGRSLSRGTVS